MLDCGVRTISLTKGMVALVDEDDFDRLSVYRWAAVGSGNHVYAARCIGRKPRYAWMHREIIDAPEGALVDHVNCNKLDNRRHNLRLCTPLQNSLNRQPIQRRTRFKGNWPVELKSRRRWRAAIGVNDQTIYLGHFDSEEEAARAYDAKAVEVFGSFAWLNFPAESIA